MARGPRTRFVLANRPGRGDYGVEKAKPVVRLTPGVRSHVTLAVWALTASLGCGGPSISRAPEARAQRTPEGVSNVTRADYVGSAVCASCHPKEFEAWSRSPMHLMTRDARTAEVRAPFDGTRWHFKGDSVVLEQRGGDRWMRLEPQRGVARAYRVTRIIGGRTREDFAGVEEGGGDEMVLPVSYVFATRALRYKGYSVMVHEREGLRAGPGWSRSCIFCHNTVPELERLFGAIAGPSARPYQGEQVDRWLPSGKRAKWHVSDAKAFELAAFAEIASLGGTLAATGSEPSQVAQSAIDSVRTRFDGDAIVEVGIGCEACHGGARDHVRSPGVPLSLVPKAPWMDMALAAPTRASEINRACARCHQVLFSRYPFTWEGGRRDSAPGGSHINSGEARDFLLGACSTHMACTACHDPHGGGLAGAGLAGGLASPRGNGVCTTCHQKLADRGRVREHAHHDPDGRGGSCLACHMPRKNMGLDGALTPYHRIGSPTDAARVLGDRPLECALCHADRTVRSLVDTMQSWWPVRYPTQRLVELYGTLDANVMRATLERGRPHEQVVAMSTLGEARARDATPVIASKLLSEYPLVREWAKRALVTLRGRCDVDLAADDLAIASQAASCGAEPVLPPSVAPVDEPSED